MPDIYEYRLPVRLRVQQEIEELIAKWKAETEVQCGQKLKECERAGIDYFGERHLLVRFETVGDLIISTIAQPEPGTFAPVDNLQAKREREAFLNRAFTREQQQAIGMILERWWSQKMAGIETQKVAEAVEEHPKRIAELEREVAELKARVLHYLP